MKVSRWKRHSIYLPITAVVYVLGVTAVVAAAKSSFDGSAWFDALGDASRRLSSPAFWSPFIGAEVLAVEVAHHDGHRKASIFLVGVSLALLWLTYEGALGSLHALAQRKWTAAGLSEGFIVIWGSAVLLVGAVLAGGMKWRYR